MGDDQLHARISTFNFEHLLQIDRILEPPIPRDVEHDHPPVAVVDFQLVRREKIQTADFVRGQISGRHGQVTLGADKSARQHPALQFLRAPPGIAKDQGRHMLPPRTLCGIRIETAEVPSLRQRREN